MVEHIQRNIEQAKHILSAKRSSLIRKRHALRHLATLFSEELDTDLASTYFRKSLIANPSLAMWAELIDLYERANKLDEAEKALTEASRILPKDANVQYVSAKLARRNITGLRKASRRSSKSMQDNCIRDFPAYHSNSPARWIAR